MTTLRTLWGVALLFVSLAANVQLHAQDCGKWCGYGSTYAAGGRAGCGSDDGCAWVICSGTRWGCSEGINDICGTPDWCENSFPN